jgi:hypothetical protein
MPITNEQQEIIKMTTIADNAELLPDTRLNAARRLLRFTEFSARSVRVAKRVAKLFYNNEDVSSDVRKKAASLLEFVLSKPADDGSPLEPLAPVVILKPGERKPQTLEDINRGWDASPVPKKFIAYYTPEDLPAFGLPADPDFTWTPERTLETIAFTDDQGSKYYVKFSPYRGGTNWILNPKYVAAFKAWKTSPREPLDPRVTEPWKHIFQYEDHFSERVRGGCPVMLMWIPNQPFLKAAANLI